MKHAKYVFSSLKHDIARLAAIVIIVLLGIAFISGLMQSGPDMQDTQDAFYRETKLADVRISLTTGISTKQVDKLQTYLPATASFSPEYSYESDVYKNNVVNYAKIYQRDLKDGAPDRLVLAEGRMPKNENEAVVLTDNANFTDYPIGTILQTAESETVFTVVGKVTSSEYVTKQIVSSPTSGRRLSNIFYFDLTYFVETPQIYTAFNIFYGSQENTYSDKYDNFIDKNIDYLKSKIAEDQIAENSLKDTITPEVEKQISAGLKLQGMTDEQIEAFKKTEQYHTLLASGVNTACERYIAENGEPSSYLLTRNECQSYAMLDTDFQKVITIANIFPVFFFLIATLVASTSISRIITKDRSMMGTFKGLGFSNTQISMKYIFYGFLSTIVGTAGGLLIGLFLLPKLIYSCYSSLYVIPEILYHMNPLINTLIVVVMFLVIMGVIGLYCFSSLRERPASLMMEKAPKPGKKILLERIKPIWKILPFSIKNMFRNVFRFKKNLIMMLIGVGGSTALMLAGFGMRDSISAITHDQYKEIFQYNFVVENGGQAMDGVFDFSDQIGCYTGATVKNENSYNFVVMAGSQMKDFVKIDSEFIGSSVVLTDNIADHFSIRVGDEFTFEVNNHQYEYTLSGITKNYVGNYLYLGSDYAGDFKINATIGYKSLDESAVAEFTARLFEDEDVENVIYTGDNIAVYDSLLSNLNLIIVILIFISGALMITVIYNLVDINISERNKEIATLKVIGYRRRELVMYIFREIILMTFIAMLLGFGFGILLLQIIILAINSPALIFGTTVKIWSYLYTFLLTIAFSIIVTGILIPKILKVDMVDSLKSVD